MIANMGDEKLSEAPPENGENAPLLPTTHLCTYRKRWFVLATFFSHMAMTNIIWATFIPIVDLTTCYYGVSLFWVNSLSWIYMSSYVPGFLLASWFLNRYGLKVSAVFGACANAAGAWLRFAGCYPGGFWFVLAGTTVASFTNTLEWSAPTMLSNTWFPVGERAIATTVFGALAPQAGILLGLVIGPLAIQDPEAEMVCSDNVSRASPAFLDWQFDVSHRLFWYLLAQALLASVILPITFLIAEAPHLPPSVSSSVKRALGDESYLTSLSKAFNNGYFLVFTYTCGLLIGTSSAYMTVYTQVLHNWGYEQNDNKMAYIGLFMQVSAMVAQLVVGIWISKTRRYYATSFALCMSAVVTTAGLAVVVQFHAPFAVISFFLILAIAVMRSFLGVGYEYAAEMTYPLPESISAGLVNAMAMFQGSVMIITVGGYPIWLYAAQLLVAALMGFAVRPAELKRQNVDSTYTKASIQ